MQRRREGASEVRNSSRLHGLSDVNNLGTTPLLVQDKAAKAAKRMQESAKDVDQQYGVRRRLRSVLQELERALPAITRSFESFASTPLGRITLIAGLFLLMTTAVFWRVGGPVGASGRLLGLRKGFALFLGLVALR